MTNLEAFITVRVLFVYVLLFCRWRSLDHHDGCGSLSTILLLFTLFRFLGGFPLLLVVGTNRRGGRRGANGRACWYRCGRRDRRGYAVGHWPCQPTALRDRLRLRN